MTAWLSTTWMAPTGQALSHAPQAMQESSHTLRATGPFSVLEQRAVMLKLGSTMWMTSCGQALAHRPQPMQAPWSTWATPRSFRLMAPLRQALTQAWQPTQPCSQPWSSQLPLHRTTATGLGLRGLLAPPGFWGAFLCAYFSSSSAILALSLVNTNGTTLVRRNDTKGPPPRIIARVRDRREERASRRPRRGLPEATWQAGRRRSHGRP